MKTSNLVSPLAKVTTVDAESEPLATVKKNWELVFLCPDDYPVSAPHIAILDKGTGSYLPAASQHINDWNLYKYMSDLAVELNFG